MSEKIMRVPARGNEVHSVYDCDECGKSYDGDQQEGYYDLKTDRILCPTCNAKSPRPV
jgi:DNA-directed RNA polymerase subunit RPC12/RpoP